MIPPSKRSGNVPNPDSVPAVYSFSRQYYHHKIINFKWSYLHQQNRLGLHFYVYLIISRDASLEPIFKGHSLLFILASHIFPKCTVHGTKFSLKAMNLDLNLDLLYHRWWRVPSNLGIRILNLVRSTAVVA